MDKRLYRIENMEFDIVRYAKFSHFCNARGYTKENREQLIEMEIGQTIRINMNSINRTE